jgi:hypothetical protein
MAGISEKRLVTSCWSGKMNNVFTGHQSHQLAGAYFLPSHRVLKKEQ